MCPVKLGRLETRCFFLGCKSSAPMARCASHFLAAPMVSYSYQLSSETAVLNIYSAVDIFWYIVPIFSSYLANRWKQVLETGGLNRTTASN